MKRIDLELSLKDARVMFECLADAIERAERQRVNEPCAPWFAFTTLKSERVKIAVMHTKDD